MLDQHWIVAWYLSVLVPFCRIHIHRVVTQPHPVQRAGPKAFNHHVGISSQGQYYFHGFRIFQIYAEATFVAIKRHELGAFSVPEWGPRPGLVTVLRFLSASLARRGILDEMRFYGLLRETLAAHAAAHPELADRFALFDLFAKAEKECENALAHDVPIAAYEQAVEASHIFNLLQARGVISVQERASYMGRVRDLARGSCEAHMAKEAPVWAEKYPEWSK